MGHINPVTEITALAHAAGAFVCVDGVSYAPHGFADVGALGPDIYLFSSYKTYGPHQGLMVIRRPLGELLPNQGHFFNSDKLYKRFTPAGEDHAQQAACACMADYIDALYDHHFAASATAAAKGHAVHDLMRDHETGLLTQVLSALGGRNSVRVLGPMEAGVRAPTVAMALSRPAEPVAAQLAKHGIMTGGGGFYAVRALEAMGIDPVKEGVLRLSFTHYTSQAEIDQLLEALDHIL